MTANTQVSTAVNSEELEFLADDSSSLSHNPCLKMRKSPSTCSLFLFRGRTLEINLVQVLDLRYLKQRNESTSWNTFNAPYCHNLLLKGKLSENSLCLLELLCLLFGFLKRKKSWVLSNLLQNH